MTLPDFLITSLTFFTLGYLVSPGNKVDQIKQKLQKGNVRIPVPINKKRVDSGILIAPTPKELNESPQEKEYNRVVGARIKKLLKM